MTQQASNMRARARAISRAVGCVYLSCAVMRCKIANNRTARFAKMSRAAQMTRASSENEKLVVQLVAHNQFGKLVLAVRSQRADSAAFIYALKALGTERLTYALSAYVNARLCTAAVHEIFRCGGQRLLQWHLAKLPSGLLGAVRPNDGATPLHVLAQRPVNDCALQGAFMSEVFRQVPEHLLEIADVHGNTPVHYLAVYGHVNAYEMVERRCPFLCTRTNLQDDTPAALHVARLRDTLRTESEQKTRVMDSYEALSSVMEKTQTRLVQQQREIED